MSDKNAAGRKMSCGRIIIVFDLETKAINSLLQGSSLVQMLFQELEYSIVFLKAKDV